MTLTKRIQLAGIFLLTIQPCEGMSAPLVHGLLEDAQMLVDRARFDEAQARLERSVRHLGKADKELLIRSYRIRVLLAYAKRDRATMHAALSRLIALGQSPRTGEYPNSVLREWRLRALVVSPLNIFIRRSRTGNQWQLAASTTGGSSDDLPVEVVLWVNQGAGWQQTKGGATLVPANKTITIYAEAIHTPTGVLLKQYGSPNDPVVLFPTRT